MTEAEQHEFGLTNEEALRRLDEVGPNKLPEAKTSGVAMIFVRQFSSPFIYILILAAVVSLAVGQVASAVFIAVVLLLNATIGTVQEYSAQRSATALRNMVRGTAHVVRDGTAQKVDIEVLVPGDLILLYSGDRVPADIRLTASQALTVDESMLTGESLAVTKNAQSQSAPGAPLAERVDHCFAGTIAVRGRGQGVVTNTGPRTQLGRIARHLSAERISEPPLMIRIRRFTYEAAAAIGIAIIALVGLMLLKGGYDAKGMIMMAVGLAVSTIPEGLPAALTVALAIGMRRMAQRNVIIRKLVAVEALGSCTFICSDKTGTLTVNELTIQRVVLPDGADFTISGAGVGPGGEVSTSGEVAAQVSAGDNERLRDLCITGALANESHLEYSGGEWVFDGDIVDVAFLVFAKKLGLSLSELQAQQARLELIPYESEQAFSGSLNLCDGEPYLYVKGSPEKMLELCDRMRTANGTQALDRPALERQFESLARQGYRIIALAHRPAQPADATAQLDNMVFLGMVAMIDPVRPEAGGAIDRCRRGGISVAMVTGDHPATAVAIAAELGLCAPTDAAVTGAMIRAAAPDGKPALDALILPARVFARIEPTQKELIVETFMAAGEFVAVTGDGVNDAPAMRRANAGVAMGKRGTDVAKESADLIITDDNFASLVAGIEQGRIVYNNIRKVIALLVATGFSALLLFFCTVSAGLPMPLSAIQLLWLNLIANGLQDVALAFEPREGGELERAPRNPTEHVFERHIIEHVVIIGTTMGLGAFATFWVLLEQGVALEQARNLTLMLMVLFGNIHALSARSETRSLFALRFFANPFLIVAVPLAQLVHIGAMYAPGLSDVLELSPISFDQWLMLVAVALGLFGVEEGHKWWLRRRSGSTAHAGP